MEQNPQSIARLVQKYLLKQRPNGATLDVVEQGIYQERSAWYVPVRPSHEPVKRYEYYEALADVETELDENEHLNVLLVPVVPEEAAALTV